MKVFFIGCLESSYQILKQLLAMPEVTVVGVLTRRESEINADLLSLEPLAGESGIPCKLAEECKGKEVAEWLRELQPDVGFCVGWSYLLKAEIFTIPKLGFIGYHPTALPRNRGRHPIIWALALGLSKTASTFFFIDEGADSGDILSQVEVEIRDDDNARTLYDKLCAVAAGQVKEIVPALIEGSYERIVQDHGRANYWRKRTARDGAIDWRMSARSINNLVRALTRPYPGAHCGYRDGEVKIWRSSVPDSAGKLAHLEPGKVLAVEGSTITVKCGEGILNLLEHGFDPLPEEGSYL